MSEDQSRSNSQLCDQAIATYRLLDHPFYEAWNKGTLPVAALSDYAREYGAFIETIAEGWSTVGASEIAEVEREHAEIWRSGFAAGLGTAVTTPQVDEVKRLVDISNGLFADRATALGALYAFEAQQPGTSESKLTGLKKFYADLPVGTQKYFDIHRTDYDEPALLASEIDSLVGTERERAVSACEQMSRGLYDALTGIHAPYTRC